MRMWLIGSVLAGAIFVAGGCGSETGTHQQEETQQTQQQEQPAQQPTNENVGAPSDNTQGTTHAQAKYTCPHCGGDFDAPGKCPACGMDLVEKKA